MNNAVKKTTIGIATIAAAGALVAGFAGPAMASTGHDSAVTGRSAHTVSDTSSRSSNQSTVTEGQLQALRTVTTGVGTGTATNWSPVVIDPALNAPVTIGDVGSGNAVASGNDVPVLSGNSTEAPVLSGNQSAVGNVGSVGNGATVGNDAANGDLTNSISSSVNNLVTSVTDNSGNSSSTTSTSGIVDSLLGNR